MNILSQEIKTMSSREIAELCNKRHDHVCRDIDALNQSYVELCLPKVGEGYYTHPKTGSQQHRQFLLNKEQTIDLMTGYNRELRILINRRWQELEANANQPAIALPDFTNPADAAIAWAAQYKATEEAQAQLAAVQPKITALQTISSAKGELGVREAAKAVGMRQNEFVAWCIDQDKPLSRRFMYRGRRGVLRAYSHRIDAGLMTEKLELFIDHKNEECTSTRVKFTPAGITKIAEMLAAEGMGNSTEAV